MYRFISPPPLRKDFWAEGARNARRRDIDEIPHRQFLIQYLAGHLPFLPYLECLTLFRLNCRNS